MAGYKKRTTRRMPPKTRKLAKLINDLASVERRLKNLLPDIQTAEMFERAQIKRQEQFLRNLRDWLDNNYLVKTGDQYRITSAEMALLSKGVIPGKMLSESIEESRKRHENLFE